MKVLIHSTFFEPSVGGVERFVASLAGNLSRLAEVVVVTNTDARLGFDKKYPFSVVRRPNVVALWRLIQWADSVLINGPALLVLVLTTLWRRPVAVVHHGYQASCPNGLLLQQPSLSICSSSFMRRQYGQCIGCRSHELGIVGGVSSVSLLFLRRALLNLVGLNIAVSDHVRNRIDLPRSIVIKHAMTQDPSHSPPTSRGAGLRIGFVGRLVREKGVNVVIRAVSRLEASKIEVTLDIIGDGPERRRLENLTESLRLGPRVRFHGQQSGAQLFALIEAVDVFVVPSVCEETAGLVVLEAIAASKIIFASSIGGMAEYIGEPELLFKLGDDEALAARLREYIEAPEKFRLVAAGVKNKWLSRGGPEVVAQEYLAALESVVASDN